MNSEQLQNKLLNEQEYARQSVNLQSSPPNVILCTTYKCNMRCIFCQARGVDPDFNYTIYKNLFEKKLNPILKKAVNLCFTGWGEVLLFPEIEDFLDHLNSDMPETNKVFTTNGVALSKNLVHKIIMSNYSLQISLHTSKPLVHRFLTQSSSFERIIEQLDYMVLMKRQRNLSNTQLCINLMFLITSLNIESLPDFVDFAAQHGVNAVACNYITIYKPQDISLSCFFLPHATNQAFDEAKRRAEKDNIGLNLPLRFGIENHIQQQICQDPWNHVYIDALGNILPCCYSGHPIGNIKIDDFEAIWNGEQYRTLRSSLIERRPSERCKDCFKFSSMKVDDIRAHITFRYNQGEILEGLDLQK